MQKSINIASPIHGFFEHHLVLQRGLSPHTVLAYRDTMKLFLQFAVQHCRKSCTDLMVDDLTPDTCPGVPDPSECIRKNRSNTQLPVGGYSCLLPLSRNQRPPLSCPLPSHSCSAVQTSRQSGLGIPGEGRGSAYLSTYRPPEASGETGRRPIAPALQHWERAQELVDLNVYHVRFGRPYYVRIHGKGPQRADLPGMGGDGACTQDLP